MPNRYLAENAEAFDCLLCPTGRYQPKDKSNVTSCTVVDVALTYAHTKNYFDEYKKPVNGPFAFTQEQLQTGEDVCHKSTETSTAVPSGHYGCFDVDVRTGAKETWITVALRVLTKSGLFCPTMVPVDKGGGRSFCRKISGQDTDRTSDVPIIDFRYRCCGVRHKQTYVILDRR